MTLAVLARRNPAVRTDADEAGFGMIELLIAMTIMSVGILAVFAVLQSGLVQIKRASSISTAAALSQSEMEGYRAIRFMAIGLADASVSAGDAIYQADSAFKTDTPSTTASVAMTTAAGQITVASTSGFPATAPFRIKIDSEIMLVTTISGSTWTVNRAQDNTTAATHASGAAVVQKRRADLAACGSAPCTTSVPTKTVTGADGKSYRVDTFITWQLVASSGGTTGRNVKLVTIVVRDPTTNRVYARDSSSFDEATGL